MIFTQTALQGAYVVEPEKIEDQRGFFCRTWCTKVFKEHGLNHNLVQCNISYNKKKGTLRGMHFQVYPHEEAKLVRCTMGAFFDVIIDMRPKSATFMQWVGVELSAVNRKMLYIPEGFAHGFQTLEDNTEVFYQMSEFYYPEAAKGLRWNDPQFNIEWPEDVRTISPKDQSFPDFEPYFILDSK